ncbi:MAG: hypothetical protein HYR97_07220 [Candidatus Melainabacteria bacterium]|nr:hypothetical protein [Candidatus Melainabacteria bacterium]
MKAVLLALIVCMGPYSCSYAATEDSLTGFVNNSLQGITGSVTFENTDSATEGAYEYFLNDYHYLDSDVKLDLDPASTENYPK